VYDIPLDQSVMPIHPSGQVLIDTIDPITLENNFFETGKLKEKEKEKEKEG
jgi:hypothetical protein